MSSAPEPQVPSEAPPPPAGAAESRPKKKKLKAKAPPPPPPSEDEIDSPTKQTLGMLGVIGIMTLCMWVFARGGCNYHPPKESRDPRKVELTDLARDPKDAAMEFELRFATKSFGGALELAKGPAVLDAVKQQQVACDADPSCAQQASTLRSQVLVSAELLEREPQRAVSRVTTVGAGGPALKHIVRVERDGQIWKVVSREVDDGSFKPRPASQTLISPRDGGMLLRQPGMPGSPPPAASASP